MVEWPNCRRTGVGFLDKEKAAGIDVVDGIKPNAQIGVSCIAVLLTSNEGVDVSPFLGDGRWSSLEREGVVSAAPLAVLELDSFEVIGASGVDLHKRTQQLDRSRRRGRSAGKSVTRGS